MKMTDAELKNFSYGFVEWFHEENERDLDYGEDCVEDLFDEYAEYLMNEVTTDDDELMTIMVKKVMSSKIGMNDESVIVPTVLNMKSGNTLSHQQMSLFVVKKQNALMMIIVKAVMEQMTKKPHIWLLIQTLVKWKKQKEYNQL